jgi:FtsH-binding integral membrane protein
MIAIADFDAIRHDLRARMRWGFTLPLAGCLYWLGLAYLGQVLGLREWILAAFVASGLIFPVAVIAARAIRTDLLQTGDPLAGVALQAVIGMNLLWPLHFVLFNAAPQVVPLSLAIGMSVHWPVVGWMLGTRLGLAHAIARAIGAWMIWTIWPADRLTLLPAFVALCYAATALCLFIKSSNTCAPRATMQTGEQR